MKSHFWKCVGLGVLCSDNNYNKSNNFIWSSISEQLI